MNFLDKRVQIILNRLKDVITSDPVELEGFLYKDCGYKHDNSLPTPDDSWREFKKTDLWGGVPDRHAWFYKHIVIPDSLKGKTVELAIHDYTSGWDATNPQFIAYIDGQMVQGLDVNHRSVTLPEGGEHDVWLYAYTGMIEQYIRFTASLYSIDLPVEKLYYDLYVPMGVLEYTDPDDKLYADIIGYLNEAVNLLDLRELRSDAFYASVKAADEYLEKNFYGKFCGTQDTAAVCIGHTHIDVAWLWTYAQTREKTQRSFSTVISLMEKDPEYQFMSSQAQLYKYLPEDAPEMYEKVKKMIAEGRWEVEGAMWVEADCNLTSGESLVRQVLYVKRFFREEFGVDSRVLWLPDVFGYSAALPQILMKSGVDRFVTSKISWNEFNKLPCDVFFWRGIDGTEIFTHFLTAQDKFLGKKPVNFSTYVANTEPKMLAGSYERMQQKDISNESIVTYGYGDGGGGPTKHHIDVALRLARGIPGCPQAKLEFAGDYLNRLYDKAANNRHTPKWVGELYFELHRGTYTSIAKNKRNNRKSEQLYQTLETSAAMAQLLCGADYPRELLHNGWETILLNQFHDVLPGSSIKEVYDDTDVLYKNILSAASDSLSAADKAIAGAIGTEGGLLVFNPNSFTGSGVVNYGGKSVYVDNIPAKGYRVVRTDELCERGTVSVSANLLENDFFRIELDDTGAFTRIYDKRSRREVMPEGARGNLLEAFEDYPKEYDAWEITNYYEEKMWLVDDVVSIEPVYDGARSGLRIVKRFLSSTIAQNIWIYDDIARIDFDTEIDWKQDHILLKAAFPVDVNATRATYEIQFGCTERPTHRSNSWDAAQFEVCAHKFADLSEDGYGAALINDCKYGHDIHDGVMRLSLLKSATYPNPDADKCHHEFRYSFMPHAGGWREANVVREAYSFNLPLRAVELGAQTGTLPESYSMVSVDSDDVIIDTVKRAEDSDSLIVRAYECWNRRANATLKFGFDVKRAVLCDLLENELEELEISENSVTLPVKPYEIVTIKLN